MKKVKHLLRKSIVNPLAFFIKDSRCIGVILLTCTILSIVISNSFAGEWYRTLWQTKLFSISFLHLPNTPGSWINNFLMAFFFFMAGMEIKRELMVGEMASFKKAILPFGAALGGMVVPALIFVAFNTHSGSINGWGIPTATDIAFSLGVASLLGKRVPVSLKIFLMALAIIDDLGAIIVVALFYGGKIDWFFLSISGLLYGSLFLLNHLKVQFGKLHFIIGICLWYALYNAGIEASIAGVLFAFAVPANKLALEEKIIHKYVNFMILPLFALANTAMLLPTAFSSSMRSPLGMGIMVGLMMGKPIGIFLFSRLLVSLKIAQLPGNVKWNQFLGMGTLAGIGFTMSIFTATLAFRDAASIDVAKIAILISVLGSMVLSGIYFFAISIPFKHVLPRKIEPKFIFRVSQSINISTEQNAQQVIT